MGIQFQVLVQELRKILDLNPRFYPLEDSNS